MKYQGTVDAARLEQAMELGGQRGEVGDYLVAGDGPGFLFLKASTFEMMFRPVNGGAPAKAARGPYQRSQSKDCGTEEAADEPGRKQGQIKALVFKALGQGPKKVAAIAEWIRAHGLPNHTTARVSAMLTYLGKDGQVQRGKDHTWHLKG